MIRQQTEEKVNHFGTSNILHAIQEVILLVFVFHGLK